MMNDEQFEGRMQIVEVEISQLMAKQLRSRDTAQREAIERIQAELDEYVCRVPGIENERDNLREALTRLQTENAELRKDKDRLDRGYIMTGVPGVNAYEHRGIDLRAAIDRVTQLDEQRAQHQAMTKVQP